jgi:hypothetical protein
VLNGGVVDDFGDQLGFTNPGTAKKANLAAF